MGGRRRGPAGVREQVDYGTAELVADEQRRGGWTLLLDGTPQSYVDVNDPGYLDFEYVRRLASVVDGVGPAGAPVRVLHLGGGALTLPRYVAATRPGSAQQVAERDAALIALVRRELPLPRGANIRVRAADAREVVESAGAHRYHLVIADVFGGARMPGHLATREFAAQVARVLRTGGIYAVNVADGAPLTFTRALAATLATAFGQVCLIAEPGVLRGRRFGNVVLVAGARPDTVPIAQLASAAARDMFPGRLLEGDELVRFMAGAAPMTDAAPVDSPVPPPGLFR